MASTKPGDGNAQKLWGGYGQTTGQISTPGWGSSSTTEALDGEKACWSYCTVTELQNNPHMLLSKRGGQPFPWKARKCVSEHSRTWVDLHGLWAENAWERPWLAVITHLRVSLGPQRHWRCSENTPFQEQVLTPRETAGIRNQISQGEC